MPTINAVLSGRISAAVESDTYPHDRLSLIATIFRNWLAGANSLVATLDAQQIRGNWGDDWNSAKQSNVWNGYDYKEQAWVEVYVSAE